MTAFSTQIKHGLALLLITAALFTLYIVAPANAESRMAGTVHRQKANKPEPETPAPIENAVETKTDKTQSSASVLDVNFTTLESQGLLSRASEGGLGIDVWHGTRRSTLVSYIPQLPGLSEYRTMQDLSKRLLLTTADAKLLRQDVKAQPGSDLTTLRMEKLLEMGAYKEALALYTKYPDQAYHERFARAGVLAALYSRESALACLEAKTVEDRFKNVAFWQQIAKICDYVLSNASGKSSGKVDFPDSKILQQVVKSEKYRYKPGKLSDMEELKPLEAAVLAAENRFDLGHITFPEDQSLPQHVLGLLMEEPSISEEQRFLLMIRAVRAGLKSVNELSAQYENQALESFGSNPKSTSFAGYQKVTGWKRLPYLYRAATNAARGEEEIAIIKKALLLVPEYGSAALWPFAEIIGGIDPASFETAAIRNGINVLTETGAKALPEWDAILYTRGNSDGKIGKSAYFQNIAYMLREGFSPDENIQGTDNKQELPELSENEQQLLKIIYEKLDITSKFHNYGADEVYEKHSDLTSSFDYVMPSIGLLEDLERAEKEKRLGEVILLSSIALGQIPPDNINPELFNEVIDGLVTVGLTDEAQSLAREVMLGLSKKI